MVRLDDVGLAGLGAGGLDNVGIDSALGEPLYVAELARLVVEDLNEGVADDLALGFRLVNTLELTEEEIFGVGADNFDTHVLGECRHNLIALVETEQAVVDEHTDKLVADRLVQQRGNYGGIDAAGKAE